MTIEKIIAFVRGTTEFAALSSPDQASIAAGDREVLAKVLQQRIAALELDDASKANSVRAVLLALNNL